MTVQIASVRANGAFVSIELPPAEAEVVPGVAWGAVEAFPTPAYWAYQVRARRAQGHTIRYRLGTTLREELGACLLGGHGIPARVGVEAFHHLRRLGAFGPTVPTEESLRDWLSQPLNVNGRSTRYRFASQKARYLSTALRLLRENDLDGMTGLQLRNQLVKFPGIGFKTASWIARNWLDADDVAILDIHILRAGAIAKFFDSKLTVDRNYLQLEQQFLRFSQGLGVRASELDAVMWLEMMSAPRSVNALMSTLSDDCQQCQKRRTYTLPGPRPKNRNPNALQLTPAA